MALAGSGGECFVDRSLLLAHTCIILQSSKYRGLFSEPREDAEQPRKGGGRGRAARPVTVGWWFLHHVALSISESLYCCRKWVGDHATEAVLIVSLTLSSSPLTSGCGLELEVGAVH